MPKTRQQIDQLKAQRRKEILEAALEEFANDGYHQSSVSQIAQKAGVAKGTIYTYFKGKEELLNALMESLVDEGKPIEEMLFNQGWTPQECLLKMTHGVFTMIEARPDHWRFLIRLSLQRDVIEKASKMIADNNQRQIERLQEVMKNASVQQPKSEAYFFVALLDGILLQKSSLAEQYPWEDMKRHIIQFIQERYDL